MSPPHLSRWINESPHPRVEWRGLTAFARRNKACVFRETIYVTLFWDFEFLQNILELRLSPEIPNQIDWHLKIQNTTFLCIKFPPPILSPLDFTCGWGYQGCSTHKSLIRMPHISFICVVGLDTCGKTHWFIFVKWKIARDCRCSHMFICVTRRIYECSSRPCKRFVCVAGLIDVTVSCVM